MGRVSDAVVSLIVLGVTVALFVWNRLPVGIVAVGSALVLYFCGLISVDDVTAGLGASVIAFIAALFVVTAGLEASGITAWIGGAMSRVAGTSPLRVTAAITVLAAILSALITVNGAAAALVPVAVAITRHAGLLPSRVLIPLAFAASAGALLTLSGSPVNVIIDEAAVAATGRGFGFFEFALVGLPILAVTVGLSVLLGGRLLPERASQNLLADLRDYLGDVMDHYDLDRRVYRLRVEAGSAAIGVSSRDVVDESPVVLLGTQHGSAARVVGAGRPLADGDVLVVAGADGDVKGLALQCGLVVEDIAARRGRQLVDRDAGISEVVIPPRSPLVGTPAFPGMVRPDDDLLVLSIRRRNKDVETRVDLAEGDTLLVQGRWPAIESLDDSHEVLVVGSSEQLRRQTAGLARTAPRAAVIMVGTIALLASGVVPPVVAALLGAVAMVGTGVLRSEQAYRAISWSTLVLIAALMPMSSAIADSGGAELIARPIVALAEGRSPYLLLAALFVLTAVLGQFISNAATVLIVIPVALAAAAQVHVDPRPVLMLVCVAGAASLLTPIATPANMIVMGPGGYRFGDYWRLGAVLMAAWLVVAVFVIPVFWPFRP